MKNIQIHQLDYAPVIAEFYGHEHLAKICIAFLNADLCRADNVIISAEALLRRNFFYLSGTETKKKKKLVVELAECPLGNDSEFIQRIYEVDGPKHLDNKFRSKLEGRNKNNRQ